MRDYRNATRVALTKYRDRGQRILDKAKSDGEGDMETLFMKQDAALHVRQLSLVQHCRKINQLV